MFDFLKKFKKECVNTYEQLEKTESETKEQVREEEPITAVIDGLLYDTSKSKKILIMYNWNSNPKECLYVTPNNRFFITCGTKIEPKTEDEVKGILSSCVELYQEFFGKVEDA